jgi:hypothetical protein
VSCSGEFDLKGAILAEAISKTFSGRGKNIQSEPIALTNSFVEDTAKAAQWGGFIRKNRLKNVPKISWKWSQQLMSSSDQLRNGWQPAPLSKGPGRHQVLG